MNFNEKLAHAISKNKSLVCVGLDTSPDQVPQGLGVFEFNKAIIDATADLACAYKPNLGFYEILGAGGLDALKKTVDYIPRDIPVIGDAKRGDIGNTAKSYAQAMFDHFKFDAATVNPYLGFDSLEPFLKYTDKGIFVLCRTSNAGAVDFQSLRCETRIGCFPLYEVVAQKAQEWNTHGNIGLVVGATYPEELKLLREHHPTLPFLIPGIGAQGGDLALTISYGSSKSETGKSIINSSRGIIFASKGKDFAEAARRAAAQLRDQINAELAKLS